MVQGGDSDVYSPYMVQDSEMAIVVSEVQNPPTSCVFFWRHTSDHSELCSL